MQGCERRAGTFELHALLTVQPSAIRNLGIKHSTALLGRNQPAAAKRVRGCSQVRIVWLVERVT